jgi:hypothetical protein
MNLKFMISSLSSASFQSLYQLRLELSRTQPGDCAADRDMNFKLKDPSRTRTAGVGPARGCPWSITRLVRNLPALEYFQQCIADGATPRPVQSSKSSDPGCASAGATERLTLSRVASHGPDSRRRLSPTRTPAQAAQSQVQAIGSGLGSRKHWDVFKAPAGRQPTHAQGRFAGAVVGGAGRSGPARSGRGML